MSIELNESNLMLLDGKYLHKLELKSRLMRMNVLLDHNSDSEEYYIKLYNKSIIDNDKRIKIQHIIDKDYIDNMNKILNFKRQREMETPSTSPEAKVGNRLNKKIRYDDGIDNNNNDQYKSYPDDNIYRINRDITDCKDSSKYIDRRDRTNYDNLNENNFPAYDNNNYSDDMSNIAENHTVGNTTISKISLIEGQNIRNISRINSINTPEPNIMVDSRISEPIRRDNAVKEVIINNMKSPSPNAYNSRHRSSISLPVASNNRNELINQEIPRLAYANQRSVSSNMIRPNNRPQRSNNSIIVNIRDNPKAAESIEVSEQPSLGSIYTKGDVVCIFAYCTIATGILYLILYSKPGFMKAYLNNPFNQIAIIVAVISLFTILIGNYVEECNYYLRIAKEDYNNVKRMLESNYDDEEHPLGIFISTLINKFSDKHKLKEGIYIKNVLPLLYKEKDFEGVLVEKDVIIQDHVEKSWNLK